MAEIETQPPIAAVEERDTVLETETTPTAESHPEPEQHEVNDGEETTPGDAPAEEVTPAPAADGEPTEPAVNGVGQTAEPAPADAPDAPEPEVKKPVPTSPTKPKARASVSVRQAGKPAAGPTTPTVKKVRVQSTWQCHNVYLFHLGFPDNTGSQFWHVWCWFSEGCACSWIESCFIVCYYHQTHICNLNYQKNI